MVARNNFDMVVWSDGMLVRPHHFQQNDLHWQSKLTASQSAVSSYYWGFTSLKLDQSLLLVGTVQVLECSGFFPDGTPFHFGDQNAVPSIDLASNNTSLTVYLGIPQNLHASHSAKKTASDEDPKRFAIHRSEVQDCSLRDGSKETISTGILQPRLITTNQTLDGYTRLPILKTKFVRDDRSIVVDDDFLPPALKVSACERLSRLGKEIENILKSRSEVLLRKLSEERKSRGINMLEFSMVQTLERYRCLFTHFNVSGDSHPIRLYEAMLSMIGELSVFQFQTHCLELDSYKHDDLWKSFNELVEHFKNMVTKVVERSAAPIKLEESRYGILRAPVQDIRMFETCDFIIAVACDLSQEKIKNDIVPRIKVASLHSIEHIVNQQLHGADLELLTNVPQEISYQTGTLYYRVSKKSDLWEDIKTSGGFGLFNANKDVRVGLELWIVQID